MAVLRLFASIRVAAGTGKTVIPGDTVGEIIDAANKSFGQTFTDLLPVCRIWVNGEQAELNTPVVEDDEVAILPPISGG
ncbi:MAG TPA: MoaD/ThiS family protein [Acidimicrobiales bacterium]|nr:MoaD/ThiS family protein [Acidimicrobiales bacterium]|tara:strand:+ start:2435 stop:2671 length:237 start_codon:yes stop_codon:yes gene_type:complete